ncbi:MAG: phosphatidylglycerophosphatase A [Gammaproteobacteria bacterium]|nr:phosphatidylglycerophosphatase A [Gammaproteobacteria bacterium]
MRVPLKMLRDPGHFLAFGAGAGLLRVAPGTWGSVVGVGVYIPMSYLDPARYWLLVGVLFAVGVPLCARAGIALGVKDHPAIVWDEIVGMLVTLGCGTAIPVSVAGGFILFRVFDIAKPGPIGLADRRLSGGFGIMADDLLAGVAAGFFLALIEYLSYS